MSISKNHAPKAPPLLPIATPGAQTPAQSTPKTTPLVTPAQDEFDAAPGECFTNKLLGLDTNADGKLTKQELATGVDTLQQLATDGRECDAAEGSVLRLLMNEASLSNTPPLAYSIEEGKLTLHVGQGDTQRTLAFAHEDTVPSNEILLQGPNATVAHGTDPGDFYCEHMFFTSQLEASNPESSVVTNAQGEKLVGFLHVPSDAFTSQATPSGYTQAERHSGTRQVIGAALRGYYDQAAPQREEGPVRLLVTGYDTFGWVKNNPTGEFAAHQENLDASMQAAFGDALQTPEGTLVPPKEGDPTNAQTYRYEICDPTSGETREVLLTRAQFTVDDQAISAESETSIQNVMAHTTPHGVIAMGVAGRGNYKAEHRADSGGLARSGDAQTHVEDAPATVQLRDNFSLARAIQAGTPTDAPE